MSNYDREVEVDVTTTVITERTVTQEVVAQPAASVRRRGSTAVEDVASAYRGLHQPDAIEHSADGEDELERRRARDLVRAVENRRVADKQQQPLKTFFSSPAREEDKAEEEEYGDEGEYEEGEEEEEEEEYVAQEDRRGRGLLEKGKERLKRTAREVEDVARRNKERAKRAIQRRRSKYYSTPLLFRLALAGLVGAILCGLLYDYFLGWGPSRPQYYVDGSWRTTPPGSKSGSWGIPYVGETIDYYRDPFKFTLRHAKKYGPISYTNALGEHTVMLSGSKALGEVFYNSSLVQRQDAIPAHIATLLGRDILPALDSSHHAEVRGVLNQAINPRGVIQSHLYTLERVMNRHLAKWTHKFGPFDLLAEIKGMTASMASTLFFTQDASDYLAPRLEQIMKALSAYPSSLHHSNYQLGIRAKDDLITWYGRAIEDHLQEIEANSNKYNGDVLDLLLKLTIHMPFITPRHLAHELHYMVLSMYELYNPISALFVATEQYYDWLPILREEVEEMHLDPDYPAAPYDRLHENDLLSLFINETRRFYPSSVIEWGKARITFPYDGYIVPSGFTVMGCVAATHMDSADFPNPETFDPTRFAHMHENEYAFVPHGGGHRNSATSHRCMGEDLSFYTVKLFLMQLLSRHDWRLAGGQNVNFDTKHYLPEPHSLRAASFSNTTSSLIFTKPTSYLIDTQLNPDHIAIAVA